MKKTLYHSELGMSLIEVMIALFIMMIILYQILAVDFEKPKKRIEGKEAVDSSVREIANFLNHEPFCTSTFQNKKFLNTSLSNLKNKRITIDEIKGNNNHRLYGTYDRYKNSNNSNDHSSYEVDYSEIDGNKLKSNIVLKTVELTGPLNGSRSGYAKLILTYSSEDQEQIYTRNVPIFIHLNSNGLTHTIQACSISSNTCRAKDFDLPTKVCTHATNNRILINQDHASGTKLRHRVIRDLSGCACIGSSYCYKGYWSHKSVCFKE